MSHAGACSRFESGDGYGRPCARDDRASKRELELANSGHACGSLCPHDGCVVGIHTPSISILSPTTSTVNLQRARHSSWWARPVRFRPGSLGEQLRIKQLIQKHEHRTRDTAVCRPKHGVGRVPLLRHDMGTAVRRGL